MIKKIVVTLLLCSAALMLFVACGGVPNDSTGNTSTSGSSNEVHMSAQTFVQASITISKGSSIALVDDVGVPHHIASDTGDNNNGKPMKETNAPSVNVQLNDNAQQTLGPLATATTSNLYSPNYPALHLP